MYAGMRRGRLILAAAGWAVLCTHAWAQGVESITVSGKSPMVEVTNPTTTMNIDATFQKALPLTEGGFWTDFLQMTPGVLSRPHNDGSGRQNYYASGVEHREHVTQMDGFMAANYWDMNVNRTGLSGEAISDTNVKLAGVDASARRDQPECRDELEERLIDAGPKRAPHHRPVTL